MSVECPYTEDELVKRGRWRDLSNDHYHAAPGISKSHLDDIAPPNSPLHYWAAHIDPNRERERTEALDVGQACHTAILEPEKLEKQFAFMKKVDGRTNDGKAYRAQFQAANLGKVILSEEHERAIKGLRDRGFRNSTVRGLLSGGTAENSFFARDARTGCTIKARPDYFHNDGLTVVDVKSCVSASPRAFGRAAGEYRYDLAAPWYFDVIEAVTALRPKNFIFIAFEKAWPFAIGIHPQTPAQIHAAWLTARVDLGLILKHRKLNEWPDFSNEPTSLQLPPWVHRGESP